VVKTHLSSKSFTGVFLQCNSSASTLFFKLISVHLLGWLLYFMQTNWLVPCSKLIFAQTAWMATLFYGKQLGGDIEINWFQQRQVD
jgi:hypothetical protein